MCLERAQTGSIYSQVELGQQLMWLIPAAGLGKIERDADQEKTGREMRIERN